jgi:uncharacterized membrane protein
MIDTVKRLWTAVKGWRTVMLSLLLAIVGVLQTADWATIVPPRQVGPVMLVIAIVVAVLRVLTDTPLGTKAGKEP